MSLPRCNDEAALRAVDRKLSAPDSVFSKSFVAQLASQSLEYKEGFLINSVMRNLVNLVRCALEAQVSADTKTPEEKDSTLLLIVAAAIGSTPALKALLAGGASIDLADKSGCTALAAAAGKGQLSCLQLLLDAGANANTQDWLGNTPLMEAVMHTQVECARALLPASNLATANRMGLAAFHVSAIDASDACLAAARCERRGCAHCPGSVSRQW